ncbi:MAG: TRAP transporter small permease [Gammaproteobacteria bacterium]|nr:TRAP transporter small permease [Gammaproteobacteria bacterium]
MTVITSVVGRLFKGLRDLCVGISSLSLVAIVVIFAWLVFGRYVLNDTPTWVEQVALVLICYITFLGSAAGVHDDTHLGVDFIRESLPSGLRYVIHLFADASVCVLGAVMFFAASELVQFGWSTKLPMLGIPEGVRTLPMAICGALMFLFSSYRLVRALIERGYPAKSSTDPTGETH